MFHRVLSLLGVAGLVSNVVSHMPWLTAAAVRNLRDYIVLEVELWALQTYDWVVRRLWRLAIAATVYFVGLAVVIMFNLPWLTFIWAMIGVAPTMIAGYAIYLLTKPLSVAAKELKALGSWLWTNVPASIALPDSLNPAGATQPLNGLWRLLAAVALLPINVIYIPFGTLLKATGGVVQGIGAIIEFAEQVARSIARGLAVVTVGLQTLAILCLVDQILGWHVVDPWVLGYLTLAIPIYLGVRVLNDNHGKIPGIVQAMIWLGYLGLGLLVASRYLTWTEFTKYVFVWGIYPPLAFCIALQLAILKFSLPKGKLNEHGTDIVREFYSHPLRRILGPAIGSFLVWFVLFPSLTSAESSSLWAQRLVHFQFWRLNNVNTGQTQRESDPLLAQAERDGVVPSQSAIHGTFAPAARRIRMLADEQQAFDAGADPNGTPQGAVQISSGQAAWLPTGYINGPAIIRVGGRIKGATPAGIPKPAAYAPNKTVMEMLGDKVTPYLALLLYTCKAGSGCTPKGTIPDNTLVCPGDPLTGESFVWFNEFVGDSFGASDEAFHYNKYQQSGSFWIKIDQDDPRAAAGCSARTPPAGSPLLSVQNNGGN